MSRPWPLDRWVVDRLHRWYHGIVRAASGPEGTARFRGIQRRSFRGDRSDGEVGDPRGPRPFGGRLLPDGGDSLDELLPLGSRRQRFRAVGGIVLGLFILGALLSLTGLNSILTLIRGARIEWLLVAAMAYMASFVFRTWRWQVLLSVGGHRPNVVGTFRCILCGWFINFLVPARAGDLVRGVALRTTEEVPFGVGMGSIVVERILDMLVLALGLLVITAAVTRHTFTLSLAVGAIALAGLMAAALLALYYVGERFEAAVPRSLPGLEDTLAALRVALERGARDPRGMSLACALSLPVWTFEASTLYFTGLALGLGLEPVPVLAAGISAFVTQAIPVTPAGIGTFEVAVTGVLSLFGVPVDAAFGLGLVDHGVRLLVVFVVGGVSLVQVLTRSRHHLTDWFGNP